MVRVLATDLVTLLGVALLTGAAAGDEGKAKELTVAKALEAMEWALTDVDARKGTVSIYDAPLMPEVEAAKAPPRVIARREGSLFLTGLGGAGLPLASDATITVDGKPAKVEDLKRGMIVSLKLGEKGDQVTTVEAKSRNDGKKAPPVWKLVAADGKKGIVNLGCDEKKLTVKDVPVAEGAKVHEFPGGTEAKFLVKSIDDLGVD